MLKATPVVLLIVAPPVMLMYPLVKVLDTSGTSVRWPSVTAPLTANGPSRKLVPKPHSAPSDQLNKLLQTRLPLPVSVPPECTTVATVAVTVLVSTTVLAVPAPNSTVPPPLNVPPSNV